MQDILDGIDSAFGFIIDIANDLIAKLLSGLNLDDLFSLPGNLIPLYLHVQLKAKQGFGKTFLYGTAQPR